MSRVSSQIARNASFTFAFERALVREEQVLRELLRDRGAALDDALRLHVRGERAEGAGEVDAEVFVEAPVFGGEHGLDQVVRHFVELDRVVVADAAFAELVAVAVEEDDGELALLDPVLVRGFAERGHREREQRDRADAAEREAFRDHLDAEFLEAADVEAVHEGGEVVVARAQVHAHFEQRVVDARVEVEQEAGEAPRARRRQRLLGGAGLFRLVPSIAAAEEQVMLSLSYPSPKGRVAAGGGRVGSFSFVIPGPREAWGPESKRPLFSSRHHRA